MKQNLLVLALLFASSKAIAIKDKTNQGPSFGKKALVEIELNSTAYESERQNEESPLSDEFVQEI